MALGWQMPCKQKSFRQGSQPGTTPGFIRVLVKSCSSLLMYRFRMHPWKLVPLSICHRRKAAEFTSTGIPGGVGRGQTELVRLGRRLAPTSEVCGAPAQGSLLPVASVLSLPPWANVLCHLGGCRLLPPKKWKSCLPVTRAGLLGLAAAS